MENPIIYDNALDIETAKNMLAICYDNLVELDNRLFIASVDGEHGIIDIDNEIKYEFQRREIIKVGSMVFIRDGGYFCNRLDMDTLKETDNEFSDIRECGKAVIARKYGNYGILGSNGKYIMPPIYNNIRVNKEHINWLDVWVSYEGHQFITQVDIEGTKVTKFDEIETEDPSVRIVATSFKSKRNFYNNDYTLQYDVFNNFTQVTNEKFSGIMYLKAYIPFKIIHTFKDNYAGLVRPNGQIIIPNTRYKKIEGIGYNGIYLVAENKDSELKWGIYQEGRGLIIDTCFTYTTTKQGIPITYLYGKVNGIDDWWVLGNTGQVYKEVAQAFPLYKLEVSGVEAYKVDVYGHIYTINSKFETIRIPNYADNYWKRIN